MGACVSSHNKNAKESGEKPQIGKVYVIHTDGRLQEFKQPIRAKNITSQNPNFFLCNSENMFIGTCMPQVPDDEDLQPGQIYFLVPVSEAQNPLTLPDLCALAIKASSVLCKTQSYSFFRQFKVHFTVTIR